MNRLIDFVKSIYLFIIFVILELIAFNVYQGSSIYVKGEVHNTSNILFGGVFSAMRNVTNYFSLKNVNEEIMDRNAVLMGRLSAMEHLNMRLLRGDKFDTLAANVFYLPDTLDSLSIAAGSLGNLSISADSLKRLSVLSDSLKRIYISLDSLRNLSALPDSSLKLTVVSQSFKKDRYIPSKVLNNSLTGQRNFLTLDRGEIDSVKVNYPVVYNDAVVGYIVAVNENYSVAISVLNVDFKTSGALGDGSLCSIFWKGKSYTEVEFSGISRYSKINIGDTIRTTGFSSFFTENKLIGVVNSFELVDNMFYSGKLTLLAPFSRLRDVQIIFPDKIEKRLEIEDEVNNIEK